MLNKELLLNIVAEELDIPPSEISVDDDLVNLGLDSLGILRIVERFYAEGYKVGFSSLALEPSLSSWGRLPELSEPVVPAESKVAETSATAESFSPKTGSLSPDTGSFPLEGGSFPAETEPFPLATMQHAYWLGRRDDLELGGVAAHLYVEFDGSGIDEKKLASAVEALVERHPMLRTRILEDGRQQVCPSLDNQLLKTVDYRDLPNSEISARLLQLREEKSHQRLNISIGQVIDITLSMLPNDGCRLHVDVDMVASDAMSYRVLLDDLAVVYMSSGNSSVLPTIGYTFRQYITDVKTDEERYAEDKEWWQDRLPRLPETASLPFVPEVQRTDPTRSVRLDYRLAREDAQRLYEFARSNSVTPAMVFTTVFVEVLARWSSNQRFLLNLPLFARKMVHDDINRVVGDFTNSVLIDADVRSTESFLDRIRRVQREVYDCTTHSSFTGLEVLRELGKLRKEPVTASVVFTSGLDLGEVFSDNVREAFGEPVHIISQGPQVDIDAQVVELDGGLLINWDVRRDCLPPAVVDDMFGAFVRTLGRISSGRLDWGAPLQIPLPDHQLKSRAQVNATDKLMPQRTLHDAIWDIARETPQRPAVFRGLDEVVTYGELVEAASSVAGALQENGVKQGDTVALSSRRGSQGIIAVLGVLYAGAAYLPIGIAQPEERRNRILARGKANVYLADSPATNLPASVTHLYLAEAIAHAAATPVRSDPEDIAYVLFTSGSTGEPKGVEVSHNAAVNTIDSIQSRYAVSSEDRTLGLSSMEFDLSVLDIFLPLSVGGALVTVTEEAKGDAREWLRLIETHKVSIVNCAPGLVDMLAESATAGELQSLRLVLTGGDKVSPDLAVKLHNRNKRLRFVALGGATEAAIHSTVMEVDDSFPDSFSCVPYGVPLDNVKCRVVNERGEDCPDFVSGEIWIGGLGVARGYRGDAQRTAESFVTYSGLRWYRTGDIGRYLPDGVIEFIGRSGGMLKIRGFRVEPGEIESALRRVGGVRAATALITESQTLAAVVVRSDDSEEDIGYQDQLRQILPEYMIPTRVIEIDELPVTQNGKRDLKRIEELLAEVDEEPEVVLPADEVEAALAYIVSELVGCSVPSVTSDFFQLGGDSILATTLTARVRELLAASSFTVADVFEARTTRNIAAKIAAPGQFSETREAARILVELAEI